MVRNGYISNNVLCQIIRQGAKYYAKHISRDGKTSKEDSQNSKFIQWYKLTEFYLHYSLNAKKDRMLMSIYVTKWKAPDAILV